MQFVVLAFVKRPMTRFTQKGEVMRPCQPPISSNEIISYAEMLEYQQAQLVTGLQELYRWTQTGQGWTGGPLKETSHGTPLTHDILESLGALKQDGPKIGEHFEEDLTFMQQHLIAKEMQRKAFSGTSSELDQSLLSEQDPSKHPMFSDSFSLHRNFPPTPPNRSAHPQSVKTRPSLRTHTCPQTTSELNMNRLVPNFRLDDNVDFTDKFNLPTVMDGMLPQMFNGRMFAGATNPCLLWQDWTYKDDFQTLFNPALIS